MPKLPTFPPLAKLAFDVLSGIALVLLTFLFARRLPGDDFWNYMSGTLFLAGLVLPVAGAHIVNWGAHKLAHEPWLIRRHPHIGNDTAFGAAIWWLAVIVVGVLAVIALYLRWTTNIVTGGLHAAHAPIAAHVNQLVAERSGLAAIIVVIVVTELAWNRPEVVRFVIVRVRRLGEPRHRAAEYAEDERSTGATGEDMSFLEHQLARGD